MIAELQQMELGQVQRPAAARADVEGLEELLLKTTRWMLAREILLSMDRRDDDWHRRWLRGLASKSKVVLSGQFGYRHVACATEEEAEHAGNWLNSQGDQMKQRGNALKLAWKMAHQVPGQGTGETHGQGTGPTRNERAGNEN